MIVHFAQSDKITELNGNGFTGAGQWDLNIVVAAVSAKQKFLDILTNQKAWCQKELTNILFNLLIADRKHKPRLFLVEVQSNVLNKKLFQVLVTVWLRKDSLFRIILIKDFYFLSVKVFNAD